MKTIDDRNRYHYAEKHENSQLGWLARFDPGRPVAILAWVIWVLLLLLFYLVMSRIIIPWWTSPPALVLPGISG